MAVFRMPSLGSDMEEGKLVEWLVHPGDTVKRGDVVAVVETQKGAIEIEVFEDGVIERIDAALGQSLPVGAPLAVIRGAEEESPPEPAETEPVKPEPETPETKEPAALPPESAPEPAAATPEPAPVVSRGGEVGASPAARIRAGELGVDLSNVTGSGPQGAILLRDVDAATPSEPRKPAKQKLDLKAMREAIAAAMARSKREIPHYYLDHEVDLQTADDWLNDRNADAPPQDRMLMGALLVRAIVRAVGTVPAMNGHYENDRFQRSDTVNPGVAIALRGGGLIAPAIVDAGSLDLDGTMAAMRDLVMRARAGRLKNSEMTSGTITVSSLGESGIDGMTGIIYPPQVALVGFGSPRPLPRVVDGKIVPRQCVRLTLAADHRVSDGRTGARFLQEIDTLLQSPESL